eukprot:GFKZ01000041.1.p1 GENE.GFKZ01000041.1~~GFKZ01000041.1.p1  ORF type:complete len:510 (+),score=76.75 GFKZ01000041.1:1579-3108(+)
MASLADQFLDDVGSDTSSTPSSPAPQPRAPRPPSPTQNVQTTESPPPTPMQLDTPSDTHISPALSSKLTDLLAQISNLSLSNPTQQPTEYNLVVLCTQLISEINDEIQTLHRSLKEAYNPSFPELETLIFNPLDYARVVLLSANISDLTKVDLRKILPSGTVITVHLAASASTGRKLDDKELEHVHALCHALMQLEEKRQQILEYIESRAGYMAPNLVQIVGGAVAAKMMGIAGGLKELAVMPSCNVKVMGKTKKGLEGTSTQTTRMHEGVIFTCPLVMGLPKQYRSKAGDVVSGKACLAARVDACRKQSDGAMGRALRAKLEEKFTKWQEPPPAKTAKPLPVPGDEAKRKHRGGKRARREKERMGLTDMRRLANRVKFGEEGEVGVGNDLEGDGLGMLGAQGSNRLRVQSKKATTVPLTAKRRLAKQKRREGRSEAEKLGITGNEGGLSLASGEGLELGTRTPAPGGVGVGDMEGGKGKERSTYFSAATPFLGVRKDSGGITKARKKD